MRFCFPIKSALLLPLSLPSPLMRLFNTLHVDYLLVTVKVEVIRVPMLLPTELCCH